MAAQSAEAPADTSAEACATQPAEATASAIETAARQLAVSRRDAAQGAAAAANARRMADERAAKDAAACVQFERAAEQATVENAAAQAQALAAAQLRERVEAQALQAAQARGKADAALQAKIEARIDAERISEERTQQRVLAEQQAEQAAVARAHAAQQQVGRQRSRNGAVATPRGMLSRVRPDMIAGLAGVFFIGIAIGDWIGRNAAGTAAVAAVQDVRLAQVPAAIRLRVDDNLEEFNRRLAAYPAAATRHQPKKPQGGRAN